ncbi:MAG: MptD family putative ECF transporter S component [Lachnospiraceae bacterium]
MNTERKFIDLKELVLSVLLSCLILVITLITVVPISTNLKALYFISAGIPAVITGIAYVLMTAKSPRIGTYCILPFVFTVYYIISGTLSTALFFFIAGILSELVMIGGRDKKWRPLVPWFLNWLTYTYGGTLVYLLMRDSLLKTYMGLGMDETTALATMDTIFSVYTAPVNVLIAAVCCLAMATVGYLIGIKVLKKYFKTAGIA